MRKSLSAVILLLLPTILSAQGVRYDNFVLKPLVAGGVTPVSGALITVCTSAGTGTPCTPKVANIYSNEALTTPITGTGGAGTTNSDANGNFGFYIAPGSYVITVTGSGFTSYTIKVVLPCGTSTSCSFTGILSFTNHNAIYWAGPGATPTIDQAVTSCGANPCIVEISPTYSGPESVNLFTTSTGYKIYNGPNNVTVIDHRSVDLGAGNPTGTNLYRLMYGGRNAGAISGVNINYNCASPTDSCTGSNAFAWIRGTFPSNNGQLAGAINLGLVTDSVTVGSSLSNVTASDSEAIPVATSADNPLYQVSGTVAGVNISRTNATQDVIEANSHQANACTNVSSTAKIYYCYGVKAYQPSAGAYRNFSSFVNGDELFENGTNGANIYASSVDAASAISTTSESGQTGTITMTAPCSYTQGQLVRISGVSVGGYNTTVPVKSTCSGSSFTVFLPGTTGLGAGAGGTVTPITPRLMMQFSAGNFVLHRPLADANGWKWQTQAATDIVQITNSGLFGSGTVGSLGDGQAFLGGSSTSFLGSYFKDTSAPSGLANKTVCGSQSADHTWACSYNNGPIQHSSQSVVLHSAYTNATTTFSTIGDGTRTASFSVAANQDYYIDCDIVYQASATTAGPKIQVTGPASPTAVLLAAEGGTNATAFANAAVTAFSTPLTAFGTAGATATNFVLRITAGISNGANAGTVAIQLAANGVGTLTVAAGSSCRMQ